MSTENKTLDENSNEIISEVVIKKTPEQIEKEISEGLKGEKVYTDPEVELEPENKEQNPIVKEEKPVETPEFTFHPTWDLIKSEYEAQLGVGSFKMPEGITKENEGKMLLDFLTENLQNGEIDENIPAAAKEIIELHKKGTFDEAEWIRQRQYRQNIESMSTDDVLFNAYKNEYGKTEENKDGYSDEEIKEFLGKKSKLEKDIEAKNIKEAYKAHAAEVQNQSRAHYEQQMIKEIEIGNIEKEKIANQLITANVNKAEFLGVPFSKAETEEYNKFFRNAVKIDPKTGTSALYDLLQSDDVIYEIGAILWKGGSKAIKEKIAQAKNSTKEEIEKKLGVKADLKAASADEQNPQLVDWKKFKGEE